MLLDGNGQGANKGKDSEKVHTISSTGDGWEPSTQRKAGLLKRKKNPERLQGS